jgi:hypothetical protein
MSWLKRKDVLFKLEGIGIPLWLGEEEARRAIVNVICKR